MATVFDYLHWRGDLTLAQSPFNAVDALILARISYFPMDGVTPHAFADSISLEACATTLLDGRKKSRYWHEPQDQNLLLALAESERFRRMRLCAFRNEIDKESEKQFAAVTIGTGDNAQFLSFRGTDNTIVGWKEDFNMAFEMPVPSQRDAAKYTQDALATLPGNARIGGHSKGGNLAVYAAAKLTRDLHARVTDIFNLDGPGFTAAFLASKGYQAVRARVKTFVPQSSIVGMLLEHEGRYSVIESTQRGILQHDVYSWEILRNDFVYLTTVDEKSAVIEQTIKSWLNQLSNADREQFVDALFGMLGNVQADTFSELVQNLPQNAPFILKSLTGMEDAGRKALQNALQVMFGSIHSIAKQYLPITKALPEKTTKK